MDLPSPRQLFASAQRKRPGPFERLAGTRFGRLLERFGLAPKHADGEGLLELAGALISLRGRASGLSLASAFFDLYEASEASARHEFLAQFHAAHPRDGKAIDEAVAEWLRSRGEGAALALQAATESPCSKLIRQLNLAPGGTRRLIAMREDLLDAPEQSAGLKALDAEFEAVFERWFNAGFLELRPIEWTSPALLLERIIAYEAVHSIHGWDDLRRRVQPADRRCYGFFHPLKIGRAHV